VSGILHFCNQTLLDWYSKQQAIVESAKFGSEFTAARIVCDHIMHFRITLRYLGIPVDTKIYMFGDNQTVVINSTSPHSSLDKRHKNAKAYHRVRKMIAAKILGYLGTDSSFQSFRKKHFVEKEIYKYKSCSKSHVIIFTKITFHGLQLSSP
jgi:hypothetical protein